MATNNNNQKYLIWREALYNVFRTPNGKILKEGLIETYIDQTCLADTSEKTHYLLGQKELIQGLIKHSETNIREEDLVINGGNYND
jgi:hypothetical protein